MGIRSDVEWCDSSANPVWGCDGCELWRPKKGIRICYAGTMVERLEGVGAFSKIRYFPGRVREALAWPDLSGKPRPEKPWLAGLPRVIFWNDMADGFSNAHASGSSWGWLSSEVVDEMAASPHVHILLTKRGSAMGRWLTHGHRFMELTERWWLGVSVTCQASRSRLTHMLMPTSEAKYFVSVEPAREYVDLEPWIGNLGWVIWGGESGSGALRAELDWARRTRDLCAEHSVPFFMKQLGTKLASRSKKGTDLGEIPEDLRIREMPMAPVTPAQGRLF